MARTAPAYGAALAIASLLAAAPSAAQDFREALSAYNGGDYPLALRQWRQLAERDDADAQAALGFMLLKGLGGRPDQQESAYWYGRAADQGQPEAQLFLGLFYLDGSGVGRDYVLSYKWCDLAYSNGAADAALACRDAAAQRLSPDEMRRSSQLIADWFRAHAPGRAR
jgi:TPR repeat protein